MCRFHIFYHCLVVNVFLSDCFLSVLFLRRILVGHVAVAHACHCSGAWLCSPCDVQWVFSCFLFCVLRAMPLWGFLWPPLLIRTRVPLAVCPGGDHRCVGNTHIQVHPVMLGCSPGLSRQITPPCPVSGRPHPFTLYPLLVEFLTEGSHLAQLRNPVTSSASARVGGRC